MCGIVSIISKRHNGFYAEDLTLFENLLVLDTLRGLDSTGVFSVHGNRHVEAFKIASHPFHLFACEDWKKWRGKTNSTGRIMVGHNRKATQGSINSKNAHPFIEGNIVLVHNGTLRMDHKKDLADVDVDSHAICHAFNTQGAEETLKNLNGAFALVWWDIEKSSLFAIRNDERPLSIVETDDTYVMLSENWMALQLLAKAGKKVKSVTDVEPGTLYEFKIGGAVSTREVVIKQPVSYSTSTIYTHGGASTSSVSGGKSSTSIARGSTSNGCDSSTPCDTVATGATTTTSPSDKSGSQAGLRPSTALTLVSQSMMLGHTPCTDFPKGTEVLVKFYQATMDEKMTHYKLVGKTIEPDREEIDVIALVPAAIGERDGNIRKWTSAPTMASIIRHTTSTCGRSIQVYNIAVPPVVDVHNGRITLREWNYAKVQLACKDCGSDVDDRDQRYTSVSRKAGNKLVLTCPDCIETKLPEDMKYEFTQNRLATLQAWEQQRDAAGSGPQPSPATEAANSPTLH